VVPVDHHLGDRRIEQQRLDRPETQDFMDDLLDLAQSLGAGDGEFSRAMISSISVAMTLRTSPGLLASRSGSKERNRLALEHGLPAPDELRTMSKQC
jgi:hypothetical protein